MASINIKQIAIKFAQLDEKVKTVEKYLAEYYSYYTEQETDELGSWRNRIRVALSEKWQLFTEYLEKEQPEPEPGQGLGFPWTPAIIVGGALAITYLASPGMLDVLNKWVDKENKLADVKLMLARNGRERYIADVEGVSIPSPVAGMAGLGTGAIIALIFGVYLIFKR